MRTSTIISFLCSLAVAMIASAPLALTAPPSATAQLFNGKDLAGWVGDTDGYRVEDGAIVCTDKGGNLFSAKEYGDFECTFEFRLTAGANNGIAIRSPLEGDPAYAGFEVQVLDNHNNPTYPDGFASSIYGINPPAANPLRAPGQWQSYDIIFRRPIFKDGQQIDPGYITVFVNGVLTQDHTPLEGGGGHKGRSKPRAFPEKGPFKIQDHGNPVRFRNIWYRPLPKRAIEGGEYSKMSEEATAKKRAEIAKTIREDAAKLSGNAKALRLLESLCYEANADAEKASLATLTAFAAEAKAADAAKQEKQKGEIMNVAKALRYMTHFKLLPADNAAKADLEAVIKARDWEKKK